MMGKRSFTLQPQRENSFRRGKYVALAGAVGDYRGINVVPVFSERMASPKGWH